jgi:predicted O-methyltransferase YrrM
VAEIVALPGEDAWRVGDTTFVYGYGRRSPAGRIVIQKPPDLVALHVELAERCHGANIVELGIAAGGSTALLALLAEPRLLVACELDPNPVVALSDFIATHPFDVRAFYGVNQADREQLASIVDDAFDGPLDLVIDDASHMYAETLASFEVLFPRLGPGGLYVIEDWASAYTTANKMAAILADPTSPQHTELKRRLGEAMSTDPAPAKRPLPRLGVELLAACGSSDGVIADLRINHHWIVIERGSAALDATFTLADHYVDRWGWLTAR